MRLLIKGFYFFVFSVLTITLSAQGFKLSGSLADNDDNSSLISANIILTSVKDSTDWKGVQSDLDGKFAFTNVANGGYKLKITYVGYETTEQFVRVNGADKDLGILKVKKGATLIRGVEVIEKEVRVEQKNDTSDYNAKAYKTNPDANAEDLVTKMPGITNENGTIKAQGEQVKKVTIDGKEYFGDDASMALKNIPADVVDRVQVFDRMSDQSNFTGFDDGNSQKAMNIVTKGNMNNGVFGKIYGGYGYLTDSRYSAGANVNWFKGDRRLSFIGLSNNVNQQNFSFQDILGMSGQTGGGGRMMGMGGGPPGGRRGGGGGGFGGNSAIDNFTVNQQGGITTTHSGGINYSDVWGKLHKVKFTGSYFFNWANNSNNSSLTRQYFNAGDSSTYYKESSQNSSRNINHRVNLRVEYTIDSMNTLIFTPKFSTQQNNQTNNILGENSIAQTELLGTTQSNYHSKNFGYTASGDLVWQHKFKKQYRTISISAGTTINNKDGSSNQLAANTFADTLNNTSINQQADNNSQSYTVNGNISYTEPAGKSGMIQISYVPSYTWNMADKETFRYDSTSSNYSLLDTLLSNKYNNQYMKQNGGLSYRVKGKQWSLMVGVNGQYALLTGSNQFPYSYTTRRDFFNVLPSAQFNYRFKNNSNLRVNYRTSTSAPSITQLQSVIDNSNPLLLSSGNPNLKQTYTHFAMARYGFTNTKKGQSFFAFGSFNYTQNYVANSTIIATKDTVLNGDVVLHAGSQFTQPVNTKGNMTVNAFLNYGLPITKIKCNINFNAGFTYNRNPSLINTLSNWSNTYGVNGGVVLSSNINDKIDFTLSYFGNYNIVKNTLQKTSDNNYYTHNANLRFNWMFWKGFVFNTSLQNTLYAGIAQGYNQNIFLWNASLGYKFLKDKSLEVKASVNDVLNQNSGISRTVNDTYIEDTQTQVLKRYLLVTVTYNLKFYKKQEPKAGAGF
ncbi:MAG: outer membrane beta-barrel protein [Chitinophagales bacterium]